MSIQNWAMKAGKYCVCTSVLLAAVSIALSANPADAIIGKRLYQAHGCYGCHGFNGETGARDLVATNSPFIADEATFKMFLRLRAEQAPLLPVTRMPNYSANVLNDTDVRDLYAFVRTFQLNAPAVDSVPTLRAILKAAEKPYKP
jgi:mono/diheme cytochrome c family protein